MKVEFTGRQTEVPDAARRLAEQRLAKLARLLPKLTRAHVILTAERHRLVAEVRAHSRGLDLTAVEASGDARKSIAGALDKLLRQAERERSRRRPRRGSPTPRLTEAAGDRAAKGKADRKRSPLRARRTAVSEMTLEQASSALREGGDGVVVFRDAGSERLGVLFRRRDGRLALIEPEL